MEIAIGATRRVQVAALPLCLLALIWLLDALQSSPGRTVSEVGVLDESAHLATAVLILLASGGLGIFMERAPLALAACAGSVLLDIDHLPLFAGVHHVAAGGRPFTHSLVTVAALLALGIVGRLRRGLFLGLGLGVLLHFVRDIATGPGLPLLWPLQESSQRLAYSWYFIAIVVATGVAIVQLLRPGEANRPPKHR